VNFFEGIIHKILKIPSLLKETHNIRYQIIFVSLLLFVYHLQVHVMLFIHKTPQAERLLKKNNKINENISIFLSKLFLLFCFSTNITIMLEVDAWSAT